MSKSNDEQYWDGFDNGVISTYATVCDEIKRIRESDEQGDLLSILEDFVLEQKSVFELAFERKEQEKMSDDKTLWTGVEQLSNHIKIVDAENGGRVVVIKGMKQCRYCKWYVKDNFQCTYSHVLLLPDEACEHFERKEQEHE